MEQQVYPVQLVPLDQKVNLGQLEHLDQQDLQDHQDEEASQVPKVREGNLEMLVPQD